MKINSFLVYIFIAILASTTFLLWYGEATINNKATVGYSIFSFINSSNIIRGGNPSALTFEIENLEKNDIEYNVSTSINDKEVTSKKYLIKSKESLTIESSEEVLTQLSEDDLNIYKITIKWGPDGKNKEILKKQIKLQNESKE